MLITPKPMGTWHTIIAEYGKDAIYVHVRGSEDISGVGQNLASALGDMLVKHAPKLGLLIVEHD